MNLFVPDLCSSLGITGGSFQSGLGISSSSFSSSEKKTISCKVRSLASKQSNSTQEYVVQVQNIFRTSKYNRIKCIDVYCTFIFFIFLFLAFIFIFSLLQQMHMKCLNNGVFTISTKFKTLFSIGFSKEFERPNNSKISIYIFNPFPLRGSPLMNKTTKGMVSADLGEERLKSVDQITETCLMAAILLRQFVTL